VSHSWVPRAAAKVIVETQPLPAILGLAAASRPGAITRSPTSSCEGTSTPAPRQPTQARGENRHRRRRALLPRGPGRMGRARGRRRRLRLLVDAAPIRDPGGRVSRAPLAEAQGVCRRPVWGEASGARRHRERIRGAGCARRVEDRAPRSGAARSRRRQCSSPGSAIRSTGASRSASGTTDACTVYERASSMTRLRARPERVDPRPRPVPSRQLVLPPRCPLRGARGQDACRLAYGLPRLRGPAGDGGHRGDHGPDRPHPRPTPRDGAGAEPLSPGRARKRHEHDALRQELGTIASATSGESSSPRPGSPSDGPKYAPGTRKARIRSVVSRSPR